MKYLVSILLFLTFAYGKNDTISYTADSASYNNTDTVVTLIGNSSISYESMTLTADTIEYHTSRRIMIAVGNPMMIDRGDTLYGDYIAYNLDEQSGKVRTGEFSGSDQLYYGGERIARDSGNLYIDNGSYTTSEAVDSIHYFFYGKKIKIIPNDKSVVKPFILNIEDAPVAALPFLVAPVDQRRSSGFLAPRWSVGINGRGSVDNIGYYWLLSEYMDFMVAGKIDNFENFIIKGETNYALKDKLSGRLYADYSINDKYRGGSNRWSINFSHNQNLLPDKSFTLTGRGNLISDRDYYTDYSEDTTKLLNQNLNTDVSLTKRFNRIGGYADVTWNRSQNLQKQTVSQNLPKMSFRLNQRSLIPALAETETEDLKWFNKITWSYSANANQQMKSREHIVADSAYDNVHRGFSHSIPIRAPFSLFDYITVTPNVNLNHAMFDSYQDTTTKDTSIVYDTSYYYLYPDDLLDIDIKDSIDNGDIKIEKVLYPPEVPDTTYFVIDDIVTREVVTMDTIYYNDPEFDFEKANNFWWNAGVSMDTKLYGMFPITVGNLTGIRHTISPQLTYTFTPEKELDVLFPSVGVSSTRGTDQRQELSFRFNNLFEGRFNRNGKEKKVTLFTFNLNGSYNFEADSLRWSNFNLSTSIPTPYLDFSYATVLRVYNNDNELIPPAALSHNIRVNPRLPRIQGSFWSGDFLTLEQVAHESYLDGLARSNKTGWSLNITPRYNMALRRTDIEKPFAQTQTYNLGTGMQLDFSHRWSVRWSGNWSFTESEFINQSVSLYADLESWEMKFDWYPTGINGGRFYFLVNIKKHRDVQWRKDEDD